MDYYKIYSDTWGWGVFYPHDANSDQRGIPQFKDWSKHPDGKWYPVVQKPVTYDEGKDKYDPVSLVNNPGNPIGYGPYSAGGAGRQKNTN